VQGIQERGALTGRAWGDEVAETKGRVLVVDDESYIRDVITRRLSGEGYTCEAAADAEAALALLSRDGYDCVVTDINMPGLTGIELLRRIRLADQDVAVIMITGAPDLDGALEAMRLGAYDHQAKPLNLAHLALTVDRAVEKKRLILENRDYQRNLESMVLERTKQLHQANEDLKRLFMGTIKALAQALEAKDEYTQGHSARVAEESVKIARYLSLSEIEVQDIWLSGYLHDIGKIGIKESVLNKPGKLDPYEWECIQMHPVTAEKILAPIDELAGVIKIVRHHHERFDGSGYPDGIKGSQIPLGARILSVADSYDALTSKRSYREALSHRDALAVLEQASGTQFDPVIVRAYLSCASAEARAAEAPRAHGAVSSVQDARTASPPTIDLLALKHSNPS
jgi:response regulator RpfG family c-di-GMP phosphodiesterase